MQDSHLSIRNDWRLSTGKDRRIREFFPEALPGLWWFHFHDRRPPTDVELTEAVSAFATETLAANVYASVHRSTALQGNPYVIAITCERPSKSCVEIRIDERVCALYLLRGDALQDQTLNFNREFGEADNPFQYPPNAPLSATA